METVGEFIDAELKSKEMVEKAFKDCFNCSPSSAL